MEQMTKSTIATGSRKVFNTGANERRWKALTCLHSLPASPTPNSTPRAGLWGAATCASGGKLEAIPSLLASRPFKCARGVPIEDKARARLQTSGRHRELVAEVDMGMACSHESCPAEALKEKGGEGRAAVPCCRLAVPGGQLRWPGHGAVSSEPPWPLGSGGSK